jgi:cytidylate kinase
VTTPVVVAIDGPAGSGKSTLARDLASALDLPYVNTGIMYRALTLRALRERVDVDDGPALAALAGRMRFDLDRTDRPAELRVDGAQPAEELAAAEVESNVSRVARHPEVRTVLRAEQRRLGGDGAVLEGRDIGSVVFPDATLKLYLQADVEARVARRAQEREAEGAEGAEGAVAQHLEARDTLDARVNPFVPPADAVVIDTTSLDAAQVLARALALIRERTDGAADR